VRITKAKRHYAKGYKENWTLEIFKIKHIHYKKKKVVYVLVDLNGDVINGTFYDRVSRPGHGYDYIELPHTMLHIRGKITKTEGSDLTSADKKNWPVNDFLSVMLSKVQI